MRTDTGVALGRDGTTRLWLTASAVLLAVSAVGLLAAATFPVPVPGAPPDQVMRQGLLHMASFLTIFTPLVVALFVVGWRLRREPGWRTLGAYSLATGGATLLLVLAMFVFASPDSPWQIGGLVSRLLVVVAF